jgi:hypothetical protein
MAYQFWKDTAGHYIIPPQQLMPLYGAWNGEQWGVYPSGELATSYDRRVMAAFAVTHFTRDSEHGKWEAREVGTDGLPVEPEA